MNADDRRRRQEIEEELDAHLQARINHLEAAGATPEDARAEALRRFGNLEEGRAALIAQARRARRKGQWIERLRQWGADVRYVARGLVSKPAFSLGVIAIFTIGLGITAAVSRVAYDLLLRPPAGVEHARSVRRVEALVDVGGSTPSRATLFSYPDALRLTTTDAFADAAMYTNRRLATTSTGQEIAISEVDGRFFGVLGVRPTAGRLFDDAEVRPGADLAVAILSARLWERAFPSTPFVNGRSITIADRVYHVVGVLPKGFTGIDIEPIDLWLPLGVASRGRGSINGVIIQWYQSDMLRVARVVGRIPAGAPEPAVVGRLNTMLSAADQATGAFPRTAELRSIVPVGDVEQAGTSRQLVGRLIIVALIVLVIACANAMNLLLAHSLHRQHEVVVRLAMGASRRRVIRLQVVQSVLLALVAGVAATVAGHWVAQGLWRALFPDGRSSPASPDALTLMATVGLALLAGLVAGIPAAWQTTRPNLVGNLGANRVLGPRGSRVTRSTLVVGQTALSLTLVVLSGLLVLSMIRLGDVHLGFSPAGLVTASIVGEVSPGEGPPVSVEALTAGLRPGAVAFASVAPFGATSINDISVPGTTFQPESGFDQARTAAVTPNYFAVMETRLVEGRGFTAADTIGSDAVAIVNETMKRNYWGGEIPPGACILFTTCARVIGVVEDIRDAPGASPPMRYYVPLAQTGKPASVAVVRATPDTVPAVLAQVRGATPAGRRVALDVVADRISRAIRPWRTAMLLFLAIGAVGLVLASIGLFSVVSYLATARLPEFGLRVVLGATGADVARLVFADGARLVGLGGLVGLAGAAVAGRYLGALLFDVSPFEPVIYAVALLSLGVAAAVAMWTPARRAARVNPVSTLRADC